MSYYRRNVTEVLRLCYSFMTASNKPTEKVGALIRHAEFISASIVSVAWTLKRVQGDRGAVQGELS